MEIIDCGHCDGPAVIEGKDIGPYCWDCDERLCVTCGADERICPQRYEGPAVRALI